jgi:hypothetical protein
MENIDMPRNRTALQRVLSRFLQRDVHVHFKIMDASDTLPGDIKLPEGHTQAKQKRRRIPHGSADRGAAMDSRSGGAQDPGRI